MEGNHFISKESRVCGAATSTHFLVKKGRDSSGEWLARGHLVSALGDSVTVCTLLSQTEGCLGGGDKVIACSIYKEPYYGLPSQYPI